MSVGKNTNYNRLSTYLRVLSREGDSRYMNNAIFAMNPRQKDSRTGEVERKYNRGYAEPATAEQVKSRLLAPDVKEDTRLIREEGREDLKDTGLFTLCPHYSAFKDNHRCQACIKPEAFTYRTCVDVDEKELVEKAIEKSMEVNRDELSDWKDMVEYIEYSPRKKCHIWLLMPVGKTIEETQKAFCDDIGIPYDTSCITPERYINMTGDVIYMSNHWLSHLPMRNWKRGVKPSSTVDLMWMGDL